jgi:ubiquinone/menaquinone biosynthesis C-methylase UbiE
MGKHLDYNSFARTYSETRSCVPWALEILADEFANLNLSGEIIEVGCGTGNYSIALSETLPGIKFRGFDLSEEMLKIAKSRTNSVEFTHGNADSRFPYPDSSADAIFLVDVIHHIVNYGNFFAECRRILKANGTLIILTDTDDDFKRRSGIKFFPETLKVEKDRYPSIKELNRHADNERINFIGSKAAQGTMEIDDDFISKIERKFSSALRLIPEKAFQKGLERVKKARQNGEKWVSSYTILKYQLNKN